MATGTAALSVEASRDLPHVAAARLRALLNRRHDTAILADLLEEDLRQALLSLEAVRGHLEDVLLALLDEEPQPLRLLEAGDDAHAQAALLALESALKGLRQRLAQAARRVAPATRPHS